MATAQQDRVAELEMNALVRALSEESVAENMRRFSEPAGCHELFQHLAGDWAVEALYAPDLGMEEVEAKGEARIDLMMGGRYMKVDMWHSPAGGPRYEVFALYAYDRFSQKYKTTWVNNMNTNFSYLSGVWYNEPGVLRLRGSFTHPFRGCKLPLDIDMAVSDRDQRSGRIDGLRWEMRLPDHRGEMVRNAWLGWTRV
jgi:hypothetical protein